MLSKSSMVKMCEMTVMSQKQYLVCEYWRYYKYL